MNDAPVSSTLPRTVWPFAWGSAQALIALAGLWLFTVGNWPLWQSPLAAGQLLTVFELGALLCLAWNCLFQLLAWPWVLKPVLALALLVTAFNSYFMHVYGVVMDPSMMASALATDAREVRDLLSWSLLLTVLLLAGPGLWVLWRYRVVWPSFWRGLWQRLGVAVLAAAGMLLVFWLSYADLASLMRNHPSLRYQISPFNTVYGLGRLATREPAGQSRVMEPVATDVVSVPLPGHKPPLLMIVVGETARAANFGLSGYTRNTTPHLQQWLQQGQMVYWRNAQSCGTNTQVSVPCMFSPLSADHGGDHPAHEENLLDVMQRAGLAVLWLDNQSGCKGVCDHEPHEQAVAHADPRWCDAEGCQDEALLQGLDARLESLDPERRARGVVLVLHQMGSHGPAYYKRSPADHKPFVPECKKVTLSDCTPDELRNAYDNSIAYTDHVLDQALLWLQARERDGRYSTGLIYASDHGESLGEHGMYLHGAPKALAPSEQTHVPMLAWYSTAMIRRMGVDMDCLRARADVPVSHDHLFHTVLGIMGLQTRVHQPALDWDAPCQRQ